MSSVKKGEAVAQMLNNWHCIMKTTIEVYRTSARLSFPPDLIIVLADDLGAFEAFSEMRADRVNTHQKRYKVT